MSKIVTKKMVEYKRYQKIIIIIKANKEKKYKNKIPIRNI